MKKIISTEHAPAAIGPYSQGIETTGFIFISGQVPLDPVTGQLAAQDIAGQTKRALENLQAVLAAAGATLSDVVKTTVFLCNISDFAAMNEIYAQFFADGCPARSAVEVSALPRGAQIEIEAIAVKSARPLPLAHQGNCIEI